MKAAADRRGRRRPACALACALLLAACGEPAVQLVRGVVDGRSFELGADAPPATVRASRAGVPVAVAPVDPGGSFVLALDTGGPARIDVLDADGERLAWIMDSLAFELGFLELEVCEPGEPVDLGPVRWVDELCLPTEACRESQRELVRCYREAGLELGDVECSGGDGPQCELVCAEELQELEGCGGCSAARGPYEDCRDATACEEEGEAEVTCACQAEIDRQDRVCGVCAGGSGGAATAEGLAVVRIGCGE